MEQSETFEIVFDTDAFTMADNIITGNQVCSVESSPKKINGKWYHKIINFITFGKYCEVAYTYTVKKIEGIKYKKTSN